MRRRLVLGNWKMNGSRASVQTWCAALGTAAAGGGPAVGVLPPFPYLHLLAETLADTDWRVGAQDISIHAAGAYTGEVAGAMLVDVGCRWVLVGHSERRTLHAEGDALVATKFGAALKAGLTPVLCVGETLAEREAGVTEDVIARQLGAVLEAYGAAGFARAVVAYEPVWAVGTGRTASPAQAQAVHAFIRARVAAVDGAVAAALPILYGGSVRAANAPELFAMPDIDGGLVGGASLDAAEFVEIVRAAG